MKIPSDIENEKIVQKSFQEKLDCKPICSYFFNKNDFPERTTTGCCQNYSVQKNSILRVSHFLSTKFLQRALIFAPWNDSKVRKLKMQQFFQYKCRILVLAQQQLIHMEKSKEVLRRTQQQQSRRYYKKKNINQSSESEDFVPKNTKKKRKRSSLVQIQVQGCSDLPLEDFVEQQGSQFFELTESEGKLKCTETLRSSVHIREVLGPKPHVFTPQKTEQSLSYALNFLQLTAKGKKKIRKVRLASKGARIKLGYLVPQYQQKGSNDIDLLDQQQCQILQQREKILPEVNSFLQEGLPHNLALEVNQITTQLLTLCKINYIYESEVSFLIQKIIAQDNNKLYRIHDQDHSESVVLENRYCELLIKRNLSLAFSEQKINFINYFRAVQKIEQNPYSDRQLRWLSSTTQFLKYLKQYKPKPGKNQENSLKTCCAGCFSNKSQSFNPILRCGECGIRVHRLCHDLRKKCSACKYTRKSQDQKNRRPYCFICRRKKELGLSLQILKTNDGQQYAHTFCLLTSNLWKIENKQVVFKVYSQKNEEEKCKICEQTGKCIRSTCCGSTFHTLCSFLEGFFIVLTEEESVEVQCCGNSETHRRLSFERKFKLNFAKNLYKKTDQMMDFLSTL